MSDHLARTYTLTQAEQILAREKVVKECEEGGHQPVSFNFKMSGYCACGQYRWKGEKA